MEGWLAGSFLDVAGDLHDKLGQSCFETCIISHGTWLVGVGNPWDLKHTCLGFKILLPILAQDFES